MLAPALALAICVAYAAALWWLLRRESAAAMAALIALLGVALAVRIWHTNDFPAGLIEDEPKMLRCAGEALKSGRIYSGECVGIPLLFLTLFEAQLVPILGATRWAIRSYSLITSVLAVAAAYAVGRSLALRVLPSLALAALVACLPWAIFFGRISLGGELVFHQLLLLAALAQLVFMNGSWIAVLVGALGLCGLLHDYFCGRAMVPMALVAAVLARGRYRLFCIAVLVLALAGWLPYVTGNAPNAVIGLTPQYTSVFGTWWTSTYATFRALIVPGAGRDSWYTIRWATIHPPLLLAVAALGVLTGGVRRGLFLCAAFLGGLAPSIVSDGQFPSAHRMMMALPVIAIAVACALDRVPTRALRAVAVTIVAVSASAWGVGTYFSPEFWPVESRWMFSPERTDVIEALPAAPHPPIVVMKQLGYYFGARTLTDPKAEVLGVDNWVPADGAAIYAFDPLGAPLRPFYEQLLGAERVRSFGRAFIVYFEEREWSWIKQHGWAYEARCGATVRQGMVPVLYHAVISFERLRCFEPVTHTWRGRWQGPPTLLRFAFNGQGTVQTSRGIVLQQNGEWKALDFRAEPGDELRLTLVTPASDTGPRAGLLEVTAATERLPVWASVDPIGEGGAAMAAEPSASGDRPLVR